MKINTGDLVLRKDQRSDRIGIIGEKKETAYHGMILWYVHWDNGEVKLHQQVVVEHFKLMAERLEQQRNG